ncbi:hypothetical protein [Teredinibacter sp. KSP-S5-2]|uniref:hypothetical protein n=1 Tax=Teredinibacter sp. KSP-S5-2 TaxID=3034506 RepID=UPI0029344E3B|nr:hypothetical protein [Teredinibacter sp. KSP-S5-2]WNO08273.1 hypothetical protein P5V12_14980 [Teredinibacter sp. KSP-S5-2]
MIIFLLFFIHNFFKRLFVNSLVVKVLVLGMILLTTLNGSAQNLDSDESSVKNGLSLTKTKEKVNYVMSKDLGPSRNLMDNFCQKLLDSFNSFKDEPPMVCDMKFNADMGFTEPDWQPIKTDDIDWEMIKQIFYLRYERYRRPEQLDTEWLQEELRVREMANKEAILWQANIDIDNSGESEQVLWYKGRKCDRERHYFGPAGAGSLHVLDNKGRLDIEKYKLLNRGNSFVAFYYENDLLLSYWNGSGANFNKGGYIYIGKGGARRFFFTGREICVFKHIP